MTKKIQFVLNCVVQDEDLENVNETISELETAVQDLARKCKHWDGVSSIELETEE